MKAIQLNFENIINFIELNKERYDFIIFSDYIRKRSVIRYFQLKNIDIKLNKFLTLDELVGSFIENVEILPRYIERKIFKECCKKITKFEEYSLNENFITQLIYEYWEIKENVLNNFVDSNNLSDEYHLLDNCIKNYLENLHEISIDNRIIKYFHQVEIYSKFMEKIKEIKNMKFLFCCYYFIGPTIIKIIDSLKDNNEIEFLISNVPDYLIDYFLKNGAGLYLNFQINRNKNSDISEKLKRSKIYSMPDKFTEMLFILDNIGEFLKTKDINLIHVSFPKVFDYEDEIKSIIEETKIPYILETRKRYNYDFIVSKNEDIEDYESLGKFLEEKLMEYQNLIDEEYIDFLQKSYIKFYNVHNVIRKLNLETNIVKDFISFLETEEMGSKSIFKNILEFINMGNAEARKGEIIFISGMSEDMFPDHIKTGIIFKKDYEIIKIKRTDDYHIMHNLYWLYSTINNYDDIIITYPYLGKSYKNSLISYLIEKIYHENNLDEIIKNQINLNYNIFLSSHSGNTNKKNDLDRELCTKLYQDIKNRGFPATGISEYVKCPFKFYLEYILRLSDIERPLSNTWYGTIVHEILKNIYDRFKGKSLYYMNLDDVKSIISTELENKLKEYNDYFYRNDINEKLNELSIELYHAIKNDLNLFGRERRVMDTEKDIRVKFGDYTVNGRIDRIDLVNDEFYLILDYKFSTHSETSFRKMWEGRNDLKDYEINLLIYFYYYAYSGGKDVIASYLPIRNANIDKIRVYSTFSREKYSYFKNKNKLKFIQLNNIHFSTVKNEILKILKNIDSCKFDKNDEECEKCAFYNLCWGV